VTRWQPYPEYTPSDVDWLRKIPAHWDTVPIKYLARLKSGDSITSLDINDNDPYPVYGGHGIRGFTSDYTHEGEFALIGRQGALCGNIEYARGKFWASEHAVVAHPLQCYHLLWFGELLRTMNLNQYSVAAAQPGLAVEKIQNLRIPVPPLPEQRAIAIFLDREMARIDTLVAKQEELIELLQEKRAALISHAVTKGLDPTVQVKDFGIEWLEEIPAHWEMKRLKFITPQITVGIVITPSKYYVDEGIPCLRSLNVRENEFLESDLVHISPESNELLSKSKLNKGDLVSVRTGQPGTTAVVDDRFDGTNCIDLIITRKSSKFDSQFMSYVMNSSFARFQYSSGTTGAIQAHFNIETASNMLIPVPPLEEQIYVRRYLDRETSRIINLCGRIECSITKLREYRTTLISAAVTGKIDVRGME
jgi:type I restriction enzyme S subunit